MFVVDTDIYSLLRRGQEKVVRQAQQKGPSEKIAVAIITKWEVIRGRIDFLFKASDREQLIMAQRRLLMDEEQFTKTLVLPMNEKTFDLFFDFQRVKKLKKIGRNDLLIACISLSHGATLVTRNTRDFRLVPGLSIENWAN